MGAGRYDGLALWGRSSAGETTSGRVELRPPIVRNTARQSMHRKNTGRSPGVHRGTDSVVPHSGQVGIPGHPAAPLPGRPALIVGDDAFIVGDDFFYAIYRAGL